MGCDSAQQELRGRHVEPCSGALDGSFEVLGKASISAKPGEGTLDNPAAREHLKPFGFVRTLDDLHSPLAYLAQCVLEFWAGIPTIGKDMAQPRETVADRREHVGGAVAILNVGGMDDRANQESFCVGENMAFAPLDLFARVMPRIPPLSVVLTL